MRTVDAALFELLCQELIEEVARSARPLIVTRHGRPVAELRPLGRGRRPGGKAGRGGAGAVEAPSGGGPNGRS